MDITVKLPELNMTEDDLRLTLAVKLFEDGAVSLGKAAEVAGYKERVFAELLLHKGVAPAKYEDMDIERELNNA